MKSSIPGPYDGSSLDVDGSTKSFFCCANLILASFDASVAERSANRMRFASADSAQQCAFLPVLISNICIICNILRIPSLKIHALIFAAISTILKPLCTPFGASVVKCVYLNPTNFSEHDLAIQRVINT